VLAGDFDPHAVRTAKQNVRANKARHVAVTRMDVRAWQPERKWSLVTANLFSDLLIEVTPKIAKSIARGGRLIFSGILPRPGSRSPCRLGKRRLSVERVIRKGKWIAGVAWRG